MACYHDVTMM